MPAVGESPTIRRRRLGLELRRLRERAGYSVEEMAEHLECSQSKVRRIEIGRVPVRQRDLRDLLDYYGVAEQDREPLLALARESKKKGWWHTYGDAVPDWFQTYVGLEAEASDLRNYKAELVPGLLQIEPYARAIHEAVLADDTDEEIARLVDVRMARQGLLTREENPPRLWAILNEAVLWRLVGGRGVMREQLHHLTEMAKPANVTIQVLPFDAGAHASMVGSFMILGFPDQHDPDVVFVEHHTGSLYLERAIEVDRYTLDFDHVRATALSPKDSLALIASVDKELSQRNP